MLPYKSLKFGVERLCSQTGMINQQCRFLRLLNTKVFFKSNYPQVKTIPSKLHGFNVQSKHLYGIGGSSSLIKSNVKTSNFQRTSAKIAIVTSSNFGRSFHTTQCKKAVPPLLWVVLRPFASAAAVLFGRTFRKFWQKLPQEKRDKIINRLKKNKGRISGVLSALALGLVLYIIVHIEEEPHTKRKRFILFSRQDMRNLCEVVQDEMLKNFESSTLSSWHLKSRRVHKVMSQLMNANHEDIFNSGVTSWAIHVINDENVNNAMVLPNGTVFVFSGILNVCSTDDQLGMVLAHEIAHVLLNHQGEAVSKEHFISMLSILIITAIWAVLPDAAAFLSHIFATQTSALFIHLPFSRLMESEADAIGLNLAAKACFDVREASVFWDKMALLEELGCQETPLELLSSHPSPETRQKAIDELIPEALKLRDFCKCHKLSNPDPRVLFNKHRDNLKEAKIKGCLSCESMFSPGWFSPYRV